jgi:hypothetical protein
MRRDFLPHNTTRDTVKNLCKSILARLENRKFIEMSAESRTIAAEDLYGSVSLLILTEEDIKEKALEIIGARHEELQNEAFAESVQFRTARSMARKSLGENELNGFYFQQSLKNVADTMIECLLKSKNIDEVYKTDRELEVAIVDWIKKFNPSMAH